MITVNSHRLSGRAKELPFFSRAYGGYSVSKATNQVAYIQQMAEANSVQSILDPMGGQGYHLAEFCHRGFDVSLSDVNPGVVLLAAARSPALTRDVSQVVDKIRRRLKALPCSAFQTSGQCISDKWLSPEAADVLGRFGKRFASDAISSAIREGRSLVDFDPADILLLALPVIAARQIACFRESRNATWLKEGGFRENLDLIEVTLRTLDTWHQYAKQFADQSFPGIWDVRRTNVLSSQDGKAFDMVVTSPPYANRLDYYSMWAPEVAVTDALLSTDTDHNDQLGSNRVSGRVVNEDFLRRLPSFLLEGLEEIKHHPRTASHSYYYPYFANYMAESVKALDACSRALKPGGVLLIFVRDARRIETELRIGEAIDYVATDGLGLKRVEEKQRHFILRSHVGLVQKVKSHAKVHGNHQTEWWLAFRRPE